MGGRGFVCAGIGAISGGLGSFWKMVFVGGFGDVDVEMRLEMTGKVMT